MSKFKIGDRVTCIKEIDGICSAVNKLGKIIDIQHHEDTPDKYCVEFSNYIEGYCEKTVFFPFKAHIIIACGQQKIA